METRVCLGRGGGGDSGAAGHHTGAGGASEAARASPPPAMGREERPPRSAGRSGAQMGGRRDPAGGGDSKCARAWLRVPARAPAFVGKRRGGACVSPVRVRAGAWRPVCVGVWVGAGRVRVRAARGPGPRRSLAEGWHRRIRGWGLFFSGKQRRGVQGGVSLGAAVGRSGAAGRVFSPGCSVKRGKLSERTHWDSGFEDEPTPYTRCWGFSSPSSHLRVLGLECEPEEGGERCVCPSRGQQMPSSAPPPAPTYRQPPACTWPRPASLSHSPGSVSSRPHPAQASLHLTVRLVPPSPGRRRGGLPSRP